MSKNFRFDAFLSHSTKDKAVVRPIAERLRKDGVRVWYDEWEIEAGDSIPAKIEDGLEHSRVLVLFMSTNAFGSDWAMLESQTFRFRDPLNRERRFIPLRLDNEPVKGSLGQFQYINWLADNLGQEYSNLLDACRVRPKLQEVNNHPVVEQNVLKSIDIPSGHSMNIISYAFSPDGNSAMTAGEERHVRVWDLANESCRLVMKGHANEVWSIVFGADEKSALSGSLDGTLRVWNLDTGRCLKVLSGHDAAVLSVSWQVEQHRAVSGGADHHVRLWNLDSGECELSLLGHKSDVSNVALNYALGLVLSTSNDGTLRLWDIVAERCLHIFEGHTQRITSMAWSDDGSLALSAQSDGLIYLWDIKKRKFLKKLVGHSSDVRSVKFSTDMQHVLSGSADHSVRLWDLYTGHCLCILKGHKAGIRTVSWFGNNHQVCSGDSLGKVIVWNLSPYVGSVVQPKLSSARLSSSPDEIQYTNAKVLLVGDTSAGKTGLSMRLALDDWKPSDSTVGAWATHWKLPMNPKIGVNREIWLWDFGGQADQRLIHSLYMDDAALAVLVFDGQKENVFDSLGQWDRDIARVSKKAFTKLLVAGRIDAGGLRVSRKQIDDFAYERGYSGYFETSSKTNIQCNELKQAIFEGIEWDSIPWHSSPRLFKRLKEEVTRLRDEGQVLLRFNDLREVLRIRMSDEGVAFDDAELEAVLGLLNGPGIVWELAFGSWVLLQPELINAYAQAVIQTIRNDAFERGCITEDRVLTGNLDYLSSMNRLPPDEEKFVLLAMHQILVERGLCLREYTESGTVLVFPSYYRRERADLVGHPAVVVSYQFTGFLDDIYATLVVRLHHLKPIKQDELWKYAADFLTTDGKKLGIKLNRKAEGSGELEVYFDPSIPVEEKIVFSKYVHEHLLHKGQEVCRLRHYICPHCGTPVGNREIAMKRLAEWLKNHPQSSERTGWSKFVVTRSNFPYIICANCEIKVPLWDEMEQCFANPKISEKVSDYRQKSAKALYAEGQVRTLVGEITSTVTLAGQRCRELGRNKWGIDMEIEILDDSYLTTGQKLLVVLESSNSFSHTTTSRARGVFKLNDSETTSYWMKQEFPVMLVASTANGQIHWMDIGQHLRDLYHSVGKPAMEIDFDGERFDVMSVRRKREKVLKKIS